MLPREKIQAYKERLEKDRERILGELERISRPVDFGNDIDHFDEEADEAEELSNLLAEQQALKDQVSEIDAALNKTKEEKYGVCERCGGDIGEDVLNVAPESLLCVHCKKQS